MVEHFLDVEGVTGSSPVLSTIKTQYNMAKNFIETETEFIKNIKVKELNRNQKIGLVGVIFLFLGIFFPIIQLGGVSSPLFNTSVNMFKDGAALTVSTGFFALIIAISALVSAYFSLHQKNKFVLFSNIIATLVYLYSFFNVLSFANELNRQQAELQKQIQSSIFGSGLANSFTGLIKSYDINWFGWLVMLIGIALVFYSVKSEVMTYSKEIKSKATKVARDLKPDEKSESSETKAETKSVSSDTVEVESIKKDEPKSDTVSF